MAFPAGRPAGRPPGGGRARWRRAPRRSRLAERQVPPLGRMSPAPSPRDQPADEQRPGGGRGERRAPPPGTVGSTLSCPLHLLRRPGPDGGRRLRYPARDLVLDLAAHRQDLLPGVSCLFLRPCLHVGLGGKRADGLAELGAGSLDLFGQLLHVVRRGVGRPDLIFCAHRCALSLISSTSALTRLSYRAAALPSAAAANRWRAGHPPWPRSRRRG